MRFVALCLLSVACSGAPRPRPGMTPEEVVRTVVSALQNNDSPAPNAGVFTAYRFASPANHSVTGPYGHFMGLVKAPEFEPLRHRYPFDVDQIAISGDNAQQVVTVHLKEGGVARFKFTLHKQADGFWVGCWMVDGVYKLNGVAM